jgi:RNA polymerase sigma-70 factor (ECF subfamily)
VNAVLPIRRAVAREAPDAFAALYDETVDVAWRVLARLGVHAAELEDAVQDVFMVAHRRLGTLHGDVKPAAWVTGIAVRVTHDYRRRASRKSAEPLDDHATRLEDLRLKPDDQAAQSQAAALLLRLLDGLDPTQREVFVLAELEQWSAPEIAAATQTALNTVYSRLRLARAAVNALANGLERGST